MTQTEKMREIARALQAKAGIVPPVEKMTDAELARLAEETGARLQAEHAAAMAPVNALWKATEQARLLLIKAGPDMYEALRRAIVETESGLHAPGCIDNPTDRPCCWVRAAHVAIAKVTGETP